jgi:hypothetical protein
MKDYTSAMLINGKHWKGGTDSDKRRMVLEAFRNAIGETKETHNERIDVSERAARFGRVIGIGR